MLTGHQRFRLLIRKNFLAERRSWIRTPVELIIIIVSFIIIRIDPTENDFQPNANAFIKSDFYPPEDYTNLNFLRNYLGVKREILPLTLSYTPINEITTDIMETVCKSLKLRNPIGYKTEFELEAYFDKRTILAGVVFGHINETVRKKLTVSIRFPSTFRTIDTNYVRNKLWITRCNGNLLQTEGEIPYAKTDLYIREGFLQVQHYIFLAWFQENKDSDQILVPPTVEMRGMLHDSGEDLCNYTSSSNLNSFLYFFCFLFPCWNLLERYGSERESNIMTNQLKYGYRYRHHWLAHFCVSYVHFMVLNIIIVIILKIPLKGDEYRPYSDTNAILLFLFLSLYSAALIVFALATACMLIHAINVKLFGLFMWVASYSVFAIVLEPSRGLSMNWIIFSIIVFFNNGFPTGMRRLSIVRVDDVDRHSGSLCMALFINILLQLIIMWHFQHYRPGQYVTRSPYNFLMCRTIYRKICKPKPQKKTVTIVERTASWHNFENPPIDGETVVNVKNICTPYDAGKKTHQLQKVSFKVFRGEITVILGHKSSGKTTLLCIIMGYMKPALGTVKINHIDVHNHWKNARQYLDCCTPKNSLFDLLTVSEMLDYVILLKQSDNDAEYRKIERKKWLDYLKLIIPKRNLLVKKLNFAQKRLLCLCCALTCGTEVIVLDEPTLHMSFRERHLFWQIVQWEKPARGIIVATNSIDEAEMVADRIGILSDGVLNGYGTIFFFKTKFAVGYDLIILINPDTDVERITAVVAKYFPKILPDNQIGDQVFYKLPSGRSSVFQRLLLELERDINDLNIKHLKIIGSELSEVFMTVGVHKYKQNLSEDVSKRFKGITMRRRDLIKQQIQAMLFKKIVHQAPNIIPIIMIFVTLIMIIVIGKMSKILFIPPVHHKPIYLGINSTLASKSLAEDTLLGKCPSLSIEKVYPGPLFNKTNAMSRILLADSFNCTNLTFIDYVKSTKISQEKFGGVEMSTEMSYTAWYNIRIFHTAPMVLNLAHNLALRNVESKSDYLITIANNPMPIPLALKVNLLDNQLSHLVMPIILGFVMPLTISTFIIEVAHERRNHIIMLYKISGLHKGVYWLVSLLWDMFTFIAYAIIFVVVLAFLTIEGFSFESKMVMLFILIFYGLSAILLTYLISMYFYKSTWTSYLIAVNIHIITGLTFYVMYWDVFIGSYVFLIFGMISPSFALLEGISSVYTETKQQSYCEAKCNYISACSKDNMCDLIPQCCFDTFFKWADPGIMPSVTALVLSALLFLCIIFGIELWRLENRFPYFSKLKQMRSICYPYDDRSVVAVKKRIAEAEMRTCRQAQLMVDQLEVSIPKGAKLLHTVSFELQRGSCLAIYGPRCSGKTHLMRQLIGQDGFSFGDVYVKGVELKYETKKAYAHMGYCPQDRGLHGSFTCREMMHVMVMIRGVPEDEISDIIREIGQTLDMRAIMNKKIKTLSYQDRRKVNIALALLVSNDVIILDQPTTGLSSLARREIWNVLRYARFCGKAVVFTTVDSMECEALADEVILMEKGQMLAIGSIQALREKFSRGFYLEVKLHRDGNSAEEARENLRKDVENLNRFVTFLHEESELRCQIGGMVKFYCPVRTIVYSTLFGALEKNRRRLNISSYSISQGSIEDIIFNILDTRMHRSQFIHT